jgi:hypothetical protein
MIEIRELKAKDFFTAARIISKLGNKALKEINGEVSEIQAGILLLTTALEHAESDMLDWLADIAQKTTKEFEELPFDTPLVVIEQLFAKEDMNRFLERVRALIKRN